MSTRRTKTLRRKGLRWTRSYRYRVKTATSNVYKSIGSITLVDLYNYLEESKKFQPIESWGFMPTHVDNRFHFMNITA